MSTSTASITVPPAAARGPRYGMAELVSGGIVLLAGAFWFFASFEIRETSHLVQASFFPRIIAVGMMATGAFLAVQGLIGWLRARARGPEAEAPAVVTDEYDLVTSDSDTPEVTTGNLRRLLVLIAMFTVYAIVIIPVGYIITTFLFLVAVTMFIDRAHWVRNLIFSAVFTAVVYYLFDEVLLVILPSGILEGLL